jgi:hypothetical protein
VGAGTAAVVPGLISVVMPVRNGRAFIAAAVRSVVDQQGLAQAGFTLEVVVGRRRVHRRLGGRGARCGRWTRPRHPGPCRGISAAMNAGISAARGEFLARCDADDLYPPDRLVRQACWLTEHPDFGAICGRFSTVTAKGRPVSALNSGDAAEEITGELRGGVTRTHLCSYLVRAVSLRATGGFRPWFVTAEDVDLQLRLGQACRVWYEPAPCYVYRLHDASITHTQVDARRLFYEGSARAFLRERQSQGADALDRGSPPAVPAGGGSAATTSRRHVQDLLMGESWREHRAGHKRRAILTGLRCCLTDPARGKAWKASCRSS